MSNIARSPSMTSLLCVTRVLVLARLCSSDALGSNSKTSLDGVGVGGRAEKYR